MWKTISIITFILAIGIGAKWIIDGTQIFTKNKQRVVVVDEMFGTESVEWKEGFWLGLDIAGPTAGVLIAVGIVGLYKAGNEALVYASEQYNGPVILSLSASLKINSAQRSRKIFYQLRWNRCFGSVPLRSA